MSDTKVNAALGMSTVALVVAGSSFVYTNSQVSPLQERLERLEEDLTVIAVNLRDLKAVYTSEITRTKTKIKSISGKVTRLEKKIGQGGELQTDIDEIKLELCTLIENLNLGGEVIGSSPSRPSQEKKTTRKKKKEESEEDDFLEAYLASKTGKK
jgi:hypothetical protein